MSIVGDNQTIYLDKKLGVMGAIVVLVGAYYIFDVNYPRQYAMVMAVLQSVVMQQPYGQPCSKRYHFFMKRLLKEIDSLPDPSSAEHTAL